MFEALYASRDQLEQPPVSVYSWLLFYGLFNYVRWELRHVSPTNSWEVVTTYADKVHNLVRTRYRVLVLAGVFWAMDGSLCSSIFGETFAWTPRFPALHSSIF